MATLSPDLRVFLLHGTRTGKLATVRADGTPHVVPVWFVLDGNDIIFTTGKTTVKARAMQRDPRVCVCVDDETPPFSFASITGTVTFSEVPGELVRWATAIGGRYMGADRAEAFGKRNAVPGELVVRLVPTHVIFQRDLAA